MVVRFRPVNELEARSTNKGLEARSTEDERLEGSVS
jgi:hypothetical protein